VTDVAQVMLLVDDQDDMRNVARFLIETELGPVTNDLKLIEANGGEAAISYCVTESVDVMVLDMHMPSIDGLDVLRAIRNLADPPCVVAWSADEIALRRAVALGAERGVDKTDIEGLTEAIRACLIRAGKVRRGRPPGAG
jgi:CheY-like chemotaxis protein